MDCKTSLIGPRTQQHILKGKKIRKLQNGVDMFEDYWSDSDDGSCTTITMSHSLSKLPQKLINVESCNLKKGPGCQSFNSDRMTGHSPQKTKRALSYHPINSDGVGDSKQEISATGFEDITVNVAVDSNISVTEVFGSVFGNDIINSNLQSQININKIKIPRIISKTNLEKSKKPISRSSKKESKIKELHTHNYDYDKNMRPILSKDEMHSIQIKDRSRDEKQDIRTKRTEEKQNTFHKESQNCNDMELRSFKNIHPKQVKNNVNYEDNNFTHLRSTGQKTNSTPLKKNSSKTVLSKKYFSAKSNDTVNTSLNSHKNVSYSHSEVVSELATSNGKRQIRKQATVNKSSSVLDLNNAAGRSPENTNYSFIDGDSKRKINRKPKEINKNVQKRDDTVDQNSSKTIVLDKSLSCPSIESLFFEKRKMHENVALFRSEASLEMCSSNDESSSQISNCSLGDASTVDGNTSRAHITEKEKLAINDKINIVLDENILQTLDCEDLFQQQSSKNQKLSECENNKGRKIATDKSNFIPYKNITEASDSHDLSQTQTSNRRKQVNSFVQDRNDLAYSPRNISSAKNVSEVNINKRLKKIKIIKNNKNRQKTANDRSRSFISHESNSETASSDDLPQVQTTKRRKTVNKKKSFILEENAATFSKNSVSSVSDVNVKKITLKTKENENEINIQKTASNKKDSFTQDIYSLSHMQTSDRRKLRNLRNSSILEENDVANKLVTSSENSVVNVPEVNINKTTKKLRKIESDKSRIKTATNKMSGFARDEINLETNDYDDLSHIQTSERRMTRRSSIPEGSYIKSKLINTSENSANIYQVKIKKITKKQRKFGNNENNHLWEVNNCEIQNSLVGKVSENTKSEKRNTYNDQEELNPTVVARRSTRQRFAPFARWRNERLLYGFENGEIKTFGIDKGTKEDTTFLTQFHNTIHNRQMKKKKNKILKPKKAKVLDFIEKKEKCIHLHTKFPLVPWESPVLAETDESPKHGFMIKRMVETNKNLFGFLEIEVGKEKPPQFMPDDDLHLTVVNGKLEIHVLNNEYIVESKDMFIVPRGSAYSITNIGKRKALITFVVGNFRFLNYF